MVLAVSRMVTSSPFTTCKVFPQLQSHDPLTARQCLRASASFSPLRGLVGTPIHLFAYEKEVDTQGYE